MFVCRFLALVFVFKRPSVGVVLIEMGAERWEVAVKNLATAEAFLV